MLLFCGTHHVSQYIANSSAICCTVRSACTIYARKSDRLNSSAPCAHCETDAFQTMITTKARKAPELNFRRSGSPLVNWPFCRLEKHALVLLSWKSGSYSWLRHALRLHIILYSAIRHIRFTVKYISKSAYCIPYGQVHWLPMVYECTVELHWHRDPASLQCSVTRLFLVRFTQQVVVSPPSNVGNAVSAPGL